MKIFNSRIASLLDQGISSVVNFLITIIVVRSQGLEIFGEYIVIYSILLFLMRIHAALVCMPMVTERDFLDRIAIFSGLHIRATGAILILSPLCSTIVAFLLFDKWLSVIDLTCILLGTVGVLTHEFVRRYFLACGRGLISSILGGIYGSLICGFLLIVNKVGYLGLSSVFGCIAAGGFVAELIFIKTFSLHDYKKSKPLMNQIRNEIGIFLNNIFQWGNGQLASYVLMAFCGSREVGVLGAIRNLFGPLNVIILSMEGFIPRRMRISYEKHGAIGLKNIVVRESIIITILMASFAILALFCGRKLSELLYANSFSDSISTFSFGMFCLVYYFAMLSRVLLSFFRVTNCANLSIIGTGISAALLAICLFIFVPEYGVDGAVGAMAMSEIFMLIVFTVLGIKKFVENGSDQ